MALKIRLKLEEKIIAIISICLFLQLIICYPLWLDDFRSYPKIPVFESIKFSFVNSFDYLLFGILLLSLLMFFLGKKKRFVVALFFTLFALFILNDINRLQVWTYQLLTMLAVLLLTNESQVKNSIRTLQIIMICVYCWGGIHKLNIYFIEDIFPWFLAPFALENYLTDHHFLAYFTALLELFIGFGLIFKRTRLVTFYVAAGMHLFILVILSPIGHNWNQVVWPWNLCMIGLLYLLFYKNENSIFNTLLSEFRSFPPLPIIILFFGIMPIFNFFDAWDEQLSFKMYSGVSPEGIFYYQESHTDCIPSDVKEYFVHITPDTKKRRIILDDWAFYNLKVAPYKSKKRILQVGKKLCQCIKKPELAGLELLEVDRWDKAKDNFTNHPCTELLGNKTESK